MKKLLALLFFVVISIHFHVMAQDALLTRTFIDRLASPEMHGRGQSYQGDRAAAHYLKEQFSHMGILPLANDYFQPYSFPAFFMEGEVSLSVGGKKLTPYDQYRIAPFSKTLQQDHIRILSLDPLVLTDSLKMLKFKEEYALILSNSLLYLDLSHLDTVDKKLQKSVQQSLSEIRNSVVNPHHSLGYLIGVKELPAWSMAKTDFERDFSYIYILDSEIDENTRYIDIRYSNVFKEHETQNICARVNGTLFPDSFILFIAHYDHIGSMGEALFFPGANDNASGTATVLNLANYYKQYPLEYSTAFCLFSGEENGLKGSSHFVNHPLLDLSKVKLCINFDMFCGGEEGLCAFNGREGSPRRYLDILREINREKGYVTGIIDRENRPNSDHYPFAEKGVPSIFIFTIGGEKGGVHHYDDTSANCSLSCWENVFKLITEGIALFIK